MPLIKPIESDLRLYATKPASLILYGTSLAV